MSTASYPGMPYQPPTGYYPASGHRPGLVTAIGVTSIIVASICLLAGLIGGFWTMAMYRSAQVVATASSGTNARGGATASPALILPTPDELDADAAAKRAVRFTRRSGLIDLLHEIRPMSPAVRDQVDGMLAVHAERIIPSSLLTASEVSTSQVRAKIETMGSMPPVQAGDSEGMFFQFKGTGRLEAYANRAVFKPADGSGTLRTAGPASEAEQDAVIAAIADAATQPPSPGPATAPAATPGVPAIGRGSQIFPSGLNGNEVQSIVQKAQAATSGKLNASQLTAISSALQTQSPPLVKSQMAYSPIRLATVQPDGQAVVVFSDGMLIIDSAGTIVQQSTDSFQEVTIDPIGLTLMIGESIAAGLLAAFLMVSGILVLKNSTRAQSFHWIYALLKLPMAIIGAVAFAWVMRDVISGISRMSSGWSGEGMTTFAIWLGVAGVIYPIILMIVLSTPTVREYFAAERARA